MCCDVVPDDTCDNCIDVGAAMESTAHSIHCSDDTSDSHELPPLAAVAEGEHCILVWLGQPQLVLCGIMIIQRVCDHDQLVMMDSD